MGSSASKAVSRVAGNKQLVVPPASKLNQPPVQPTTTTRAPTQRPRVTSPLNSNPPPAPHHRKTTAEWEQALQSISGAISSSAWEGQVPSHLPNHGDKERHSASRSSAVVGKLPARPVKDGAGERSDMMEGRLSQNQVLTLFGLRRRDPERWGVAEIAERFRIEERDAEALINYTRTYTGMLDEHGQVRGYYKPDKEGRVVRFEKD